MHIAHFSDKVNQGWIARRHVKFINVTSETVHCLPDNYIVNHPSLQDIRYVLRPRFQPLDLPDLDRNVVTIYLDGDLLCIRGAVGLDTLHGSNSANVITQLFLRASPIRDALLVFDPHADPLHPVTLVAVCNALSQLYRKIWATHAFRSHISPHAFVQLLTRETSIPSFDANSNPLAVLAGLLNMTSAPPFCFLQLNVSLRPSSGLKRIRASFIYRLIPLGGGCGKRRRVLARQLQINVTRCPLCQLKFKLRNLKMRPNRSII